MLNEKKFKEIYDVKRRADQEKLSFEERAALRTRLSYPIMVAFEKWIVKEYPHVLPQGRIGKALEYTYRKMFLQILFNRQILEPLRIVNKGVSIKLLN